jgi:hypothetical protein
VTPQVARRNRNKTEYSKNHASTSRDDELDISYNNDFNKSPAAQSEAGKDHENLQDQFQ